jgi:hypothetical protein
MNSLRYFWKNGAHLGAKFFFWIVDIFGWIFETDVYFTEFVPPNRPFSKKSLKADK